MDTILSEYSASISELRKNPTALIKKSRGDPITILNRNKPMAYLVPAETYEALLDKLEDCELGDIIRHRRKEKPLAVEVTLDEL